MTKEKKLKTNMRKGGILAGDRDVFFKIQVLDDERSELVT